jgi:protein-S-isoprenylcysteine O-methyltransferase Ste14
MLLSILKPVLFLAAALAVLYLSRASLLKPNAHGFYRFFAWESILALVYIKIEHWFSSPFSWHQIISWLLLFAGLYLVFDGVRLLKETGQQNTDRSDSPMFAFEKTTHLINTGTYRYIRHPLYSSLLFLTWGIFFKLPDWPGAIIALLATFFLIGTARAEELEDINYFGDEYKKYMQGTRMFIPFLF